MFTFENPQTPIIENNTVVNYNGKIFRIENNVLEYLRILRRTTGSITANSEMCKMLMTKLFSEKQIIIKNKEIFDFIFRFRVFYI